MILYLHQQSKSLEVRGAFVLLHFITLQATVRGLLLRVLDYSLHIIFSIKFLLISSYLVQCRRYHGRRIVKRVRVYLTR